MYVGHFTGGKLTKSPYNGTFILSNGTVYASNKTYSSLEANVNSSYTFYRNMSDKEIQLDRELSNSYLYFGDFLPAGMQGEIASFNLTKKVSNKRIDFDEALDIELIYSSNDGFVYYGQVKNQRGEGVG